MTLPPKIELALGYLGGTEADRIREYIDTLDQQLRTAESIANQSIQQLAETRQLLADMTQLVQSWKRLSTEQQATIQGLQFDLNQAKWRSAYRG